ncbi:fibrous sheath CABYR-binding protein-like [Palaemon carinicauda]|uniref:fibrous sheath CABYR-binding protein-like n=1 Tax=Palaemon carinicauda TaxID=392227 RepID=UPI0035B5CEB4
MNHTHSRASTTTNMRALFVLSAFLAACHAAPQFVFVLPQGFEQLGQGGAIPEIKPLNFDFSSGVAVEPAQEAEVTAEGEATAVLDAEPAGAVDPSPAEQEVPATAEAEVAPETPSEVSPILDATPAEETALVEEVAVVEVAPVVEVDPVGEIIPSENEIVAEAVVEVIEPIPEEAPVEESAAMGKSLATPAEPAFVAEVPTPVKISPAPAVNQVDPLAVVDPRYRGFIYHNDAPDVVAAKIALFRIHADRIPVKAVATA